MNDLDFRCAIHANKLKLHATCVPVITETNTSLYITYLNYLSSPDPYINIYTFLLEDTISLINILFNYEENNSNENLLEYTFLLRKT